MQIPITPGCSAAATFLPKNHKTVILRCLAALRDDSFLIGMNRCHSFSGRLPGTNDVCTALFWENYQKRRKIRRGLTVVFWTRTLFADKKQ